MFLASKVDINDGVGVGIDAVSVMDCLSEIVSTDGVIVTLITALAVVAEVLFKTEVGLAKVDEERGEGDPVIFEIDGETVTEGEPCCSETDGLLDVQATKRDIEKVARRTNFNNGRIDYPSNRRTINHPAQSCRPEWGFKT